MISSSPGMFQPLSGGVQTIRCPTGLFPGQYSFAIVSLMTITGRPASAAVNPRP